MCPSVSDMEKGSRAAPKLFSIEQQHLKLLFDRSSDCIFIANLNGQFLEVNQAAAHFLGYSVDDLVTLQIWDIIRTDELPRLLELRQGCEVGAIPTQAWSLKKKSGQLSSIELAQVIDREGLWVMLGRERFPGDDDEEKCISKPVWEIQSSGYPSPAGQGGDVGDGSRSATTVVAPKGNEEQALHASERLYRATFDCAPVGIAHVGLDGRWLRFNDAVCNITGYAREELGELTFADITHSDDIESDWSQARALMEGLIETYRMEKRYVRPDGTSVWVQLTVCGLRDEHGKLLHFVSVIEDINLRKFSEQALQMANARIRVVADAAPVLLWETDDSGLIYCNSHYLDFFGKEFSAVKGMGWAIFMHPQDTAAYESVWRAATRSRTPYVHQCRFLRSDGNYRWLQNAGRPVGESGFVGCSVDVTELMHDQLELQEREKALQVADRHKDEFLATLAHELRSPLAAITNVGMFLSQVVESDNRTERPLAILKRQTMHLTRLVDDLMDSARIASGRIQLDRKVINVQAVIDQAVELVHPLMLEKRHQLELKTSEKPAYVYGDRARLTQALGNLLQNAAKYTDGGGAICVSVSMTEREVTISVSDNGVGMEPAFVPRVFELFVQNETTLDRSQGGLGIGLSVVKGLVEMHGGKVTAFSRGLGLGSEFAATLPLTEDIACESASIVTTRPPSAETVLIVDDNVDNADSLKMLLRLQGYEAHAVYGAFEALDAVQELRPRIILLDIGLPQMDGYEVARRIRSELSGASNCRLIAMTAYGHPAARVHAVDAGFDAHLLKPFSDEALIDILAPR